MHYPYTSSTALSGGPPGKSPLERFLLSKQTQAPLNQLAQYDVLSSKLAFRSRPCCVPKHQKQVPYVQIKVPGELIVPPLASPKGVITSPKRCSGTQCFSTQASPSLPPSPRQSRHYVKMKEEPLFRVVTTSEKSRRKQLWLQIPCMVIHVLPVLYWDYTRFSRKTEQLTSFCTYQILGPRNKAATGTNCILSEFLRAARGSLQQAIKQNNLYFNYFIGLFILVLLLIVTKLETAVSLPENRSWSSESCEICKGGRKDAPMNIK